LKIVGRQQDYPVLLKRGFGTLFLNLCTPQKYLASERESKVVFGLRGIKRTWPTRIGT